MFFTAFLLAGFAAFVFYATRALAQLALSGGVAWRGAAFTLSALALLSVPTPLAHGASGLLEAAIALGAALLAVAELGYRALQKIFVPRFFL